MQAGKGDAEMFNTDSTMRIQADTLYKISIEWQVNRDGTHAARDQIIFTVNDSVTRMDFSFGDYFCQNYMDMLISFGENVAGNAVAGFNNIEAEVSDVVVRGLCPNPDEPKEKRMCCE